MWTAWNEQLIISHFGLQGLARSDLLSAHAKFCRLLPLSCHAPLRKFKLISDVSAVAAPGSVWVLQFLDPSEGPAAETPQAKHGLTEEEARKALTENGHLPKAKLCVSLVSLYLHIVYNMSIYDIQNNIFFGCFMLSLFFFVVNMSQAEPKWANTIYICIWWVIFPSLFSFETEMKISLLPRYTSTWWKAGSTNRSLLSVVQCSFGDSYMWNGRYCTSFLTNSLGFYDSFGLPGFVALRSEFDVEQMGPVSD